MPTRSKVTEPWAHFCERVEAVEMGINTHVLYQELMKSPTGSLAQYIIYLRSELCVHRVVVARLEREMRLKEIQQKNVGER
jgi:hypothetical protein